VVLSFTEVSSRTLDTLAIGCPSLERLEMQCCNRVTTAGVKSLSALTNLNTLNLAHCRALAVHEADAAAAAVAVACPGLLALDIDGWEGLSDLGYVTNK
jgi:hypothetical protein